MGERAPSVIGGLRKALTDVDAFSRVFLPSYRLRSYQVGPARAILESVEQGLGRQFAVVFSRQAGKDEVLAQTLAFLLTRWQRRGGSAILAAPTFKPQAALSRDRLLARLDNPATADQFHVRDGYAVTVGKASARFLSAAPGANARGQTADLLLVANEAQDIHPEVWDAVFDPMAASTNATTVFLGTVWSRETLLARQMRYLEELERQDGVQRVWRVTWDEVARDLPAYGERVRARIAQFGENHPFIKTEYCLEELDGAGGLFPPERLAMLRGDHPRRHEAEPGKRYALLLDVAGEEEQGGLGSFADDDRRDSTALTVVEIVPGAGSWERPLYRVVDRMAWTGKRHTELHGAITHLARTVWRASAVVVDATGVGAGLASFLAATLERPGGRPGRAGDPVRLYPGEQEHARVGSAGADRRRAVARVPGRFGLGDGGGPGDGGVLGAAAGDDLRDGAGTGEAAAVVGAGGEGTRRSGDEFGVGGGVGRGGLAAAGGGRRGSGIRDWGLGERPSPRSPLSRFAGEGEDDGEPPPQPSPNVGRGRTI